MYDHNQMISERQAQSVAELLKTEGLKLAEDDVQGLGEDRPRYSNRFPEGRFYNRAVEIYTK
jgi:outer membrane protein OmpA-like peptidoglycan-associated protein